MEGLIENYKAKNFDLNIKGDLYAINHGLDFNGFLDTRQALGAANLVSIIKHLDERGLYDWVIYGWYGDQDFGEDFNGQMENGTSFFNESYFTNEMKMDYLWKNVPCLKIMTRDSVYYGPIRVCLSISMAPYEREYIMDEIEFKDIVIDNKDRGLFPGSGANIKVKDERYRRRIDGKDDFSVPQVLTFKMPQTFCVRIRYADTTKDSWVFILPEDVKEMSERLRIMIGKEMDR